MREAIFANPYQKVWGREGESPRPCYVTKLSNVLRGILPFGRPYLFRQAAERAVDSHADLRWGPDRKGFGRIIHRNSVCLTGFWDVTEETEYTGYFAKGSRALLIGRYSSADSPDRGQLRSLALVGKLFPTTDPNHTSPLRTASFITQQNIGGEHTDYINDAELRNAPNITPWHFGKTGPVLIVAGLLFTFVDKDATMPSLPDCRAW